MERTINRQGSGKRRRCHKGCWFFEAAGSINGGPCLLFEGILDSLEDCEALFRELISKDYVGEWPSVYILSETESSHPGYEWDCGKNKFIERGCFRRKEASEKL